MATVDSLNNATDAIDKIRDTASAHERVFLVEVMGKHSGILALDIAFATGSELALVPEYPVPLPLVAQQVAAYKRAGKQHVVIILAEGVASGHLYYQLLSKELSKHGQFDLKLSVLGHIQRGGKPSAKDRIFASVCAKIAVDALLRGKTDVFVAERRGSYELVPLPIAWQQRKTIDPSKIKLLQHLAI